MKLTFGILKTAGTTIKKIVWILGLHAFSLLLILIFINLILGGLVFYKYAFLAEKKQPEVTQNIIKFNYKVYEDVLGRLQAGQQNSE